jgi:hypothetical protein
VTLREEYRLRMFDKSVLRRIFAPKRPEITGENCIMRSFIHSPPIIIRIVKSRRMIWAGIIARMRRRGMRIG